LSFSQTERQFVPRTGFWDDAKLTNQVFHNLMFEGRSFSSLLTPLQKEQIEALQIEFSMITKEAHDVSRWDPQSPTLQEYSASMQKEQIRLAPQYLRRLEKIVGGDLWPSVVLKVNQTVASHYEDPTGLTVPFIVDGLNLNSQQKKELQKLKKQFDDHVEKQMARLQKELKSLLEQHFAAVKSELDASQREKFLGWFGDLALFESLALTDEYASVIRDVSDQTESGMYRLTGSPDLAQNKGANVPILERQDVEIDFLLYRVLTMEEIEKKVMLTADQVKQIKRELEGDDICLKLLNRRTERLAAIVKDQWELPPWLDKIFLDHQKEWLRQFEFQVYCMPYADSFGVLHPDVRQAMTLMQLQSKRIENLADDYRTKVADFSLRRDRLIEKGRQEMQAKMLSSLTPEQSSQYALWFGSLPERSK
jgi:hypothetical protein